jgi:hypothetical protein
MFNRRKDRRSINRGTIGSTLFCDLTKQVRDLLHADRIALAIGAELAGLSKLRGPRLRSHQDMELVPVTPLGAIGGADRFPRETS